MSLEQLSLKHVRNLDNCQITLDSRFNIIEGANASGKTSLLEAIYLISQVKSFRTHRINHIIQHKKPNMEVVAKYRDNNQFSHVIGLGRSRSATKIHLNKQSINQSSKLAALVPIQVITPESHRLLEDGPKFRRQFLDWGVFHVKHEFLQIWKDYHRILRQRNSALRQNQSKQQIISWDQPLIEIAKRFHYSRLDYLEVLTPIVTEFTHQLTGEDISIEYQPGWDKELSFTEALKKSFEQDCQFKHTRVGPHRADVSMKSQGIAVQVGFSRGQQKLLVCALRLAQIQYLQVLSNQSCIILVDDLPAELDKAHRERLMVLLEETQAQIFVSTTDASLLEVKGSTTKKVFHVEHGLIKEVVY